jgi:hypothetical protein
LLWQQSQTLKDKQTGCLIVDDSVPDKPYSQKMTLVKKKYSGKHQAIVCGIDPVTLL